jgi:hypothetical protein
MMGAKATIAAIVPAATHTAAAQSLGRNPVMLHAQAQQQITDCINLIKQVVRDMQAGNPSDPNIASFNTVINILQ